MTEDRTVMGWISRAELGALVVKALDDPGSSRMIYHTIDPELPEPEMEE